MKIIPMLPAPALVRSAALLAFALMLTACGGGKSDAPTRAPVFLASTAISAGIGSSSDANIGVTNLEKIRERRIARTIFEYEFKVSVHNSGQAQGGVTVRLASAGAGTTIIQGLIEIGPLESGSTVTSPDTLIVRQDRAQAFALDALRFEVTTSGPLEPAEGTKKAEATLKSDVRIFTAEEVAKIVGQTANTLTLSGSWDVRAGSIFIANGTAYKVLSVAVNNGHTVLHYTDPPIEEIFSKIQISGHYGVTDQSASGDGKTGIASNAQRNALGAAGNGFSDTIQYRDASVTLLQNTNGTLTVAVDYDYDQQNGGLKSSSIIATTSLHSTISITTAASVAMTKELAGKSFFIPINLTVFDALANRLGAQVAGIKVRVGAVLDMKAEFTSTAQLEGRIAGAATVTYHAGQVQASFAPATSGSFDVGAVGTSNPADSNASIALYLNVKPELTVLGKISLVGIDLKAGPRGALRAKYVADRVPAYCLSGDLFGHIEYSFFSPVANVASTPVINETRWGSLPPFGSCLAPTTIQFTGLSGPGTPIVFGQPIMADIKVLPVPGQAVAGKIPTGVVTINSGDHKCLSVIANDGSGGCELKAAEAGLRTVFAASYAGDPVYGSSQITALLNVDKAAVTATMLASPNVAAVNAKVTMTSVLGPRPDLGQKLPTGNVTFNKADNTPVCTGVIDGAGTATCTAAFPVPGVVTVTAHYGGDGNYLMGSSAAQSITVTPADVITLAVDSRGTWTQYQNLPPWLPPAAPPLALTLSTHGLKAGQVLEMRASGAWQYSGYYGNPETSTGATAVFDGATGFLAAANLTPADPGTSPEVGPDQTITQCSSNTAVDILQDFAINDGSWRRVKIPAGATRLLFGVSDCFHGDNIGFVTVEIRVLSP
jgi:hypothetical protein